MWRDSLACRLGEKLIHDYDYMILYFCTLSSVAKWELYTVHILTQRCAQCPGTSHHDRFSHLALTTRRHIIHYNVHCTSYQITEVFFRYIVIFNDPDI